MTSKIFMCPNIRGEEHERSHTFGEVSPKSPAVWSPASATRLQDGAWTAAGGSRSPAAVGGSLGDGGSPGRGVTMVGRRRSRTGPGDGRLTVEMSIFFQRETKTLICVQRLKGNTVIN
ncbi:hypothetical protein BDA96_03G464800 [Sorghum bicolor]|uniref:Uncharacterized protein n=1 Tax=Sorghum bicolor TaxID=4558 RepID=A0A921URY6_SORBI|nr:hypothetical protein BDA96_03G464800 [Sorghum bicolor]